MKIIKTIGDEKKLRWEIVKVLLASNPGNDFGVNPQAVSDEMESNGFDATPIDVGHALKHMGFREKIKPGGKTYRKIYIRRLKELENEMAADDDKHVETFKPSLIYIYYNGYDDANKAMKKYHDAVPEPIRLKVGKWYCQTSIKEIEIYLEKTKALVSKKVTE